MFAFVCYFEHTEPRQKQKGGEVERKEKTRRKEEGKGVRKRFVMSTVPDP